MFKETNRNSKRKEMKQELKTVYIPTEKDCDLYRCFWDRKEGRYFKLGNLNKVELITFTQEEYNQHIQDVIKETLKNVDDKVMLRVTPYDEEEYLDTAVKSSYLNEEHKDGFEIDIYRESINNTFEQTFNKYKYE